LAEALVEADSSGLQPKRASDAAMAATLFRHRPAAMAVIVFAIGISLGAGTFLSGVQWGVLTFLGLCSSLFFCVILSRLPFHWVPVFKPLKKSSRSKKILFREYAASLSVLLTFLAAGGLRAHLVARILPENDLVTLTQTEPQLVRVRGIIASPVEIRESKFGPRIPSWLEVDRSTCTFDCEAVHQPDGWIAVGGRARMDVSGHLVHVRVGDRVEVFGQMTRPSPPVNPGGFNFADYLKRHGISVIMRVEHPVAITRIETVTTWRWTLARWRDACRTACRQLLFEQLKPEECGLATSLLIGDRTLLSDDLQDQFIQTGTMHLLAISGLHVASVIGIALLFCRMGRLSARTTFAVLLALLLVFVFVTDLGPPVLRAAILALVALLGMILVSQYDTMNALAVSALLLLLRNPLDLFDIGAQLSFLAVGAILWANRWSPPVFSRDDSMTALLDQLSPWRRRLKTIRRYFWNVFAMTAAVNLATLPMTIGTFHLVAPVGLLLNLVLIPYLGVVLGLGYLLLIGGLLLPATASVLAIPFHWSLSLLQQSVAWGQHLPGGHLFVPAIPLWWLSLFYVLLLLAWPLVASPRLTQKSFVALLGWCVVGLLLPFLPASRGVLRCTFLSVGHGLATLIEFPSGETLLYDSGTIGDGTRATQAISNLLWHRGISHVDAAIVSHADHDHFSGLFGLLDRMPVGQLFINRQFLDFRQRGVEDLCELAVARGTRVKIIQADDRLAFPHSEKSPAEVRVVYPPSVLSSRSDNAASLVLQINYAGRSILLTGDLEKEGLRDVLALPGAPTDILLSPHHGGKVMNVLDLYDWALPQYAVVSSNQRDLPALAEIPASCTLLNTAISGAITFEIHPDGRLDVHQYHSAAKNRDGRKTQEAG